MSATGWNRVSRERGSERGRGARSFRAPRQGEKFEFHSNGDYYKQRPKLWMNTTYKVQTHGDSPSTQSLGAWDQTP